jgi:thiosulfate/3-mercaptopyruvate sulfurtransferase
VEELREAFAENGVDVARTGPIVTTCGSGLTAAVLTLALAECGRHPGPSSLLYDGSWTEWATIKGIRPS